MSFLYSLNPDTNVHIFWDFFLVICTMEPGVDNSSNGLTEGMIRLFTIREFVKVIFISLNTLL